MDYYQKYLKYKFKYLNLLNQSGGNKYYTNALNDVRKNGLFLENVSIPNNESDDKLYFDVCKAAVKQNGTALQYLKLDKIGDAIKNYEENIYYKKYYEENVKITTPKYKEIFSKYLKKHKEDISEICKLACEHNILAFEHVNNIIIIILNINNKIIIIDKQIYFDICMKAVERDGNVLKDVKDYNLSKETIKYKPYDGDKPYEVICKAAVKQNGLALEHVPQYIIPIVLRQIMLFAVQQNGLALKFIDNERYNDAKLGDKKDVFDDKYEIIIDQTTYYVIICKEAVKQNGLALEFVKKEKIVNSYEYEEICEIAIKKNPDAQKYKK
jgi:hypothetical protein